MSLEVPPVSQKVTTDDHGRFQIAGIGRNRLLKVRLDGPTIASQQLYILTRAGEPLEVVDDNAMAGYGVPSSRTLYYAAAFKHVASPTRPIVGVVRDKDTKQPLAGVTLKGTSYKQTKNLLYDHISLPETTTDEQGRYRLTGTRLGHRIKITFVPRDDQPYLRTEVNAPDASGLGPVTVNIDVKRGVWIEGKITDNATGKPLQGYVKYIASRNNPRYQEAATTFSGFNGGLWNVRADGCYRVVGLPGPGLLALQRGDDYLTVDQREGTDGIDDKNSSIPAWDAARYNAFARINPANDANKVTCDIMLDPGATYTGTLLDPDGHPLAGARAYGTSRWWHFELPALKSAEFTVRAYNSRRPRPVLFYHAEKRLVGVFDVPKDQIKPVIVKMQPGATVTGRLVDADGQPRANVSLHLVFHVGTSAPFWDNLPGEVRTDKNGQFRIEGLFPGYEFKLQDHVGDRLYVNLGKSLRSGATTNLGDVQAKDN
jgi:hypothetical protein